MRWEQVPDLALFRANTAAFIHDLPPEAVANVDGDHNRVRVHVLTPTGVLTRDIQLGVVRELTDIIAAAASDPSLAGIAMTGADIGAAATARCRRAAEHQLTETRSRIVPTTQPPNHLGALATAASPGGSPRPGCLSRAASPVMATDYAPVPTYEFGAAVRRRKLQSP
jgi:hypothetical protein